MCESRKSDEKIFWTRYIAHIPCCDIHTLLWFLVIIRCTIDPQCSHSSKISRWIAENTRTYSSNAVRISCALPHSKRSTSNLQSRVTSSKRVLRAAYASCVWVNAWFWVSMCVSFDFAYFDRTRESSSSAHCHACHTSSRDWKALRIMEGLN